jgi:hypothetical protein
MAFAPAAIAMAATGFKVAGGVMGAFGAKDAAEANAQASFDRAQWGRIRAVETDAAMRDDLAATLGNIDVIRSAANADSTSPTIFAVKANAAGRGNLARTRQVRNIEMQASADDAASRAYLKSGRQAMIGGLLGAAGDLMSGLSGGMKSGGGK